MKDSATSILPQKPGNQIYKTNITLISLLANYIRCNMLSIQPMQTQYMKINMLTNIYRNEIIGMKDSATSTLQGNQVMK